VCNDTEVGAAGGGLGTITQVMPVTEKHVGHGAGHAVWSRCAAILSMPYLATTCVTRSSLLLRGQVLLGELVPLVADFAEHRAPIVGTRVVILRRGAGHDVSVLFGLRYRSNANRSSDASKKGGADRAEYQCGVGPFVCAARLEYAGHSREWRA
jgi:hypothetical protein